MISDTVQVAIIASVGPTIIGLCNILHQVMVARKLSTSLKNVETQTDGMKTALVAATRQAAHAEGVNDEKIRVANKTGVPINTVVAGPNNPV